MEITFADRLVRAMNERGRSNKDLATAVSVSPAAITQWTGSTTKAPTPENLFKAADFLRVSPRWLATGDGPMDEVDAVTASTFDQETLHFARQFSKLDAGGRAKFSALLLVASQPVPDAHIERHGYVPQPTVVDDIDREERERIDHHREREGIAPKKATKPKSSAKRRREK